MQLTETERLALVKVLNFQVSQTRKNTPKLLPMSLYSSELKGREQIAGCLKTVRDGKALSDVARSRDRYFNSLQNQGLVEGTATEPKLTNLSHLYLEPLDRGESSAFWQGDGGDSVESDVIRALAAHLQQDGNASDAFKLAWYGAQTFFDYLPDAETDSVLADRELLLFLFRINSNGWEIARYFQLSKEERQEFKDAFAKIPSSDKCNVDDPIEVAAAKYKDAALNVQADVRFRISGFLKAYNNLRAELGSKLPRLDRALVMRTSVNGDRSNRQPPLIDTDAEPAIPLQHPYQLIVTGCPGSGKSYYVDGISKDADFVIRTQFHPESTFFDFVGAYKPQPVYQPFVESHPLHEGDGSISRRGKPLIDYRFVPGPFMRGLVRALVRRDENVVLLVEELNRGNAAAIFGDILLLLDRDSDGCSRYELEAAPEQRAYLAANGLESDTIRLPKNFYLWATMNSADQGVFPLDTAFRRRWSYVYKGYTEPCGYPVEDSQIVYGGRVYFWDAFRKAINDQLIAAGIHEDKLVGPYFLTVAQLKDPSAVLQKLFLYLWDDVLRFRQDYLFSAKSFSGVAATWAQGLGAPLNLTLPELSAMERAAVGSKVIADSPAASGVDTMTGEH